MNIKTILLASILPFLAISQNKDSVTDKISDTLSGKIFKLGEVVISASSKNEVKNRITSENMETQNRFEVSRSLNMLPGVSLTSSGPRNESMVSVRGFDLRAVPVYMDGIPVYVPYDGYVDLARFTTFDLSAIDVSKGFSSMLLGPNSLGGTINLISRKPIKKFEFDGALGMINSNGYRTNINIGSNLGKFYFQGAYSYLHRDSYNLSEEFKAHSHEDGGVRENSYRTDQKINFKIGWTPNKKHEYVVGYINQQGEKGTPVYAGDDNLNSQKFKPRYWKWPYWNKETFYFLSNTAINDKNYIKTRVYYDIFKNSIFSYDDSTYSTQKKPSSFQSQYNDYSYGVNFDYGTLLIPKNELKFSINYKEDIHRENNLNEPVRKIEDNTIYFALEDIFKLNDKFIIIPGISYSERKNVKAQDYDSKTKTVFDFISAKTSSAFNGQIGLFYTFKENHSISSTISRKTRFATIKDRYSYRMGTAVPNPDLKPELSDNIDVSYSSKLFKKLSVHTSLFYSHLTDAILSVSNYQPGKSQMQNTGSAEFMGVELSFNFNIFKNLTIGSNYTYIERKNLTNSAVLFTDVPNTKVFSFIQYKPIKKIMLMISSEYNSVRNSTSYGTKAPEFTLFNTVISGQIWKYLSLEAGVNNIFDKNYMLSEGYPEEGRNFFVTLRFFNHK